MALYRNIAGAEQLGLLLLPEAYSGGDGGTVFYDPGIYQSPYTGTLTLDPITLTPVATTAQTVTPSTPLTTDTTVATPVVQTTATDVTSTTQPAPVTTQVDWWPLITIAGLFYTIFDGERVLKNRRQVAFIGGLGALYYEFSRKK